ncbi:hypothetical protein W97_05550 [Coniosporium apollinis CBS 100218]|uniref:UBA domain-containing protein n=1 Tax=Coniosporium apollinis (strain CBS 100218) TaxID=1168221 RepID=R7YX21_CONA1|nr:uncharacterized protein W97_05550 [Coniosporium apollinis CBS 100218]EON66452.1 hypothetical protein W97_05550 [Coniosporium apollinis CBS 100218]
MPPPIPRKSSARRAKSDTYVSSDRVLHTPTTPVARSTIARALSLRPSVKGKAPSAAPNPSTSRSSTFPIQGQHLRGPTAASDADVSPGGAETVILKVFEALDDFDDLFATAIVNKGFYSVFKRHELSLMRKVLHAMSPSAWEHRETCPPWTFEPGTEYDGPKPEYIPETYLECYVRDSCTINALQSLIHERCQSLLRPRTAAALVSTDPQESSYVNDALWRIWTFCEIFGCGKGREDDIVGQMDWLKGGELVHQQSCRATIMSSDSFGLSSVLMCAPDYFAKGNAGGLTAEQLYDMTELWNCLGVLIQGIYGRAVEARQYGVFDRTDIEGGDIDGEEAMLEEWCSYLLTHGLSTILDLAAASTHPDPTVFTLAASKGYMTWTPPPPGASRSTFLKDALSRVYEEKIAAAFAQSNRRQQARESSLRRSAETAKRRERGASSAERPFSEWDLVMNSLDSAGRGPPLMSRAFAQPTAPPPTLNQCENVHPALRPAQHPPTQHPPVQHYPAPAPAPAPAPRPLSTYTLSNPHVREEPVSQQHPRQSQLYSDDPAVDSADRAIFRIVEMGFTAEEARRALRVTDLGDGLRVDRAVELLLRA